MVDAAKLLGAEADWLLDPALGACIVGSTALAEACRRGDLVPPPTKDIDLAWALDPESGARLLRTRGVFAKTTEQNVARGTLALKLGALRFEVTSFRNGARSIEADLEARDMTVGALAWRLHDGAILDPMQGLTHYAERRIVPCGDPKERIREHPVRHLRYYRRAQEWGFTLDPGVRKLAADALLLGTIPREALAQELRQALLGCASPGRFLLELREAGVLGILVPELAAQFDGRPAGPVRHHPEVSQSLHLILALEWIGSRTEALPEDDRIRAIVAVLCHDLGKNASDPLRLPAHHGHEHAGLRPLQALLASLPGLADAATRRLAEAVCVLHLEVRGFEKLRPGTLATLYEDWFRPKDFRIDLFSLAIGADVGGRLGRASDGDVVARDVLEQLIRLRARCESVDAAALRAECGDDVEKFKAVLHAARAREIGANNP